MLKVWAAVAAWLLPAVGHGTLPLVIATGVESRYISEGRNNLSHGGLATLALEGERENLFAGAWYGRGTGVGYEETNLFVGSRWQVAGLAGYLGYSRLLFAGDESDDNELAGGAVWSPWDGEPLALLVDYRYSTLADGGFLEIGMARDFSLARQRVTLQPSLVQAFDFGYASKAYDGPNHLQGGLTAALNLANGWAMEVSVQHTWAQRDVHRQGGHDHTWGGVTLKWRPLAGPARQ